MLKDITIGQYFPGQSFIHKMDPRMKIISTLLYIVMLFLAGNLMGICAGILLLILMYQLSGVPMNMVTKSLKPVIPVVIFTSVLNIFFVSGEVLLKFFFIEITREGINLAILMSFRILCLIAGSSLLTYTTSPIELTDAIERLLNPLKKLKVPVHELSMMMTIALRFIPTLIEETDKIINAQKARGADMESGGLMQRAKALVPILIPLFVSSFRRADELAMAMECRCYRGGDGRTRMKQLQYSHRDWIALTVMAGAIVVVLLLNV
ncbi:MAG: energy-coupling factor transporter transmembrane protein EcfT [Oscillospiraceae bacterium]|nr:energy-coupling factor transporter transmembrane protein EcfT [Oscillospiraceae bacterium]